MNERFKEAAIKSARSLYKAVPILLGILILVSIANVAIPNNLYSRVFSGNFILDPIVGASVGSILAGNPVTSYVIGGEFLKQGVSMVSVIAFLVAWVTVGLVQLPAESLMLGKRFAITRNILSFILSIIVAVTTVILLSMV
ncbi:MAG: hypothetical protein J7L43_00070 [Candidatus Aenigmarchaeota archaeon]|nr:hypothetical protein [Candidatus Aenigmarchaeota archaeon]